MTSKKRPAADPFAQKDGPKMRSGRAPLRRFIPYPNNPRTHPPAEIALLAEIIGKRGADQPIVVDERWVILKGHGRLEAAHAAKMEDFPFVQRIGLTDAEKTAMRIEDNSIPLLAGWDRELIRAEIANLSAAGYDVKLLGFGDQQLVQFTTLPGPPIEFPAVGEDLKTDYCCPSCGYRWSGNPAAGQNGMGRDGDVRMRMRSGDGADGRAGKTSSLRQSGAPLARSKTARKGATRQQKRKDRPSARQETT